MEVTNGKQRSRKRLFPVPEAVANPRIGKAQARRDFLPLVSSLQRARQPIEITDHGKPVAVLLDYETYQGLIGQNQSLARLQNLKGSGKILGDLEQSRREINEEFRQSIERRSTLL